MCHRITVSKPDPKALIELVPLKDPRLIYSYVKYLWYTGEQSECVPTLVALVEHIGLAQRYAHSLQLSTTPFQHLFRWSPSLVTRSFWLGAALLPSSTRWLTAFKLLLQTWRMAVVQQPRQCHPHNERRNHHLNSGFLSLCHECRPELGQSMLS